MTRQTIALLLLLPLLCRAADEEGFIPLFNGKDLSGWVPVNVAPNTFTVRDGIIVSTGIPTGIMRTDRMYENFILELEWMHLKQNGNAGLFVFSDALTSPGVPFSRSIEIQIIDSNHPKGFATSHGDVFAIHGATFIPDRPHPDGWMRSLPSEKRAKPFGNWNHYRVECIDGNVTLSVNGKPVSGGTKCNPRKGYICLESEGSECHFKSIRIKELPSTGAPASETATADEGFKSLYTGIDLANWKTKQPGHWRAKDWILSCSGKPDAEPLISEKTFGDVILMFDVRYKDKNAKDVAPVFVNGFPAPLTLDDPTKWNRIVIETRSASKTVLVNGEGLIFVHDKGLPAFRNRIVLQGHPVEFANIYLKELQSNPSK